MDASRQNNVMQDKIDRFYEREESKEIIRWLDPPSPVYSHHHASSKRQQETGSWLLDGSEFAEWKHAPNSMLWVCGGGECLVPYPSGKSALLIPRFTSSQLDVAKQCYGKFGVHFTVISH
jgi:hypothetical protein